jgi:hypothetical protein
MCITFAYIRYVGLIVKPGRKENAMVKTQIAKQIFGVPSLETSNDIDTSDRTCRAQAAFYRCQRRMHELEHQFEQKATEVRSAYLAELTEICGSE